MGVFQRVCALADLREESALGVEVGGQPVCLALAGGQVYAIRDECSHAEVMLSHGEVEDARIECWLHGSQFDLATGEPVGLPATEPVPVYPVKIDGDDVLVDIGQS
ncbi:non-heme iron oxygenase ferredoxin subunit [Frankia sp. Cj3]|uniref:non-heme iron oxygenase ferredoxin subunit n=1 Tax=Frankia sp. Cj3 TaxID=2880976 RepID=UPI001EF5F5E3|nr:non-heme iron oxygenase ferredoxin subunit [Frankia sp. Cj3]